MSTATTARIPKVRWGIGMLLGVGILINYAARGGTATVGGVMKLMNNLMGVVAPITTGYIVGATGSFELAFLVAGIVLLVGIFSYLFILG